MGLQGDLATLELGDLLQNLETHRRTGILTIEGPDGTSRLYFREGRLALFAADGRPGLMDVLVASGTVAATDLEAARKRRRRSRKSLGEVLCDAGHLAAETLGGIALARLTDEACELIASGAGTFDFREGKIPRGTFDPEERRLELALAPGPLLMEAARRQDHWRLIRQHVPSDSAHYVVARPPREAEGEDPLTAALLEDCDGTRSVGEVMARFPHRRFEAYRRLGELAEARVLRLAGPEDMVRLGRELSATEPERAWEVLERGLAQSPRHLELLVERTHLAEERGELEAALDALKLLVHLHLEAGEADSALGHLERAKALGADDAAVWERSFELALERGELETAAADARELTRLLRGPGLYRKCVSVYERLAARDPHDWEFQRELARSRAECSDAAAAVAGLERYARKRLADDDEPAAQAAYEEVLSLDPKREAARERLGAIRSGEQRRRRRTRRRRLRGTGVAVVLVALATAVAYEAAARVAIDGAMRTVSREDLLERGEYRRAIGAYEAAAAEWPLAPAAWFDARRRVDELRRKADGDG